MLQYQKNVPDFATREAKNGASKYAERAKVAKNRFLCMIIVIKDQLLSSMNISHGNLMENQKNRGKFPEGS